MTGYHLSVNDELGPNFEFRQLPYKAWLADHDPDKWSDEDWQSIIDVLDEYGELDREEIAEETGMPRNAVIGLINNHINLSTGYGYEVCHTSRAHYVTHDDWSEMTVMTTEEQV